MSYSSITAGAAFIRISLNDANLRKSLAKSTKEMQRFGNKVTDVLNRIKLTSADAFDAFLVASVPIQSAISTFIRFDDTLRTLQAVSGGTSAGLQNVNDKIKNLGKTTAFSAQQVAECAVELSRMGFGIDELDNSLEPMLHLVRATGEETYRLKEVSGYAAAAMRIFHIEAKDVSDVCDVLAYAANRSSVDIGDLGHSMKIAGPSAHAVNENLRDAAAALMLLSNAGIKGELAGTSLRKIYQSLAAASGKIEGMSLQDIDLGNKGLQQLKDMNVSLTTATGDLRKAADIMMDIAKYASQLKSGDKINFATDVFDLRGSLGALTMLADADNLSKFRAELNNVSNYAKKTSKEVDSGLGQKFREFRAVVEDLKISFGSFMATALKPFLEDLKKVASSLASVFNGNNPYLAALAKLSTGVLIFGGALRGIVLIADTVKKGFSPIIKGLDVLTDKLSRSKERLEEFERAKKIAAQNVTAIAEAKQNRKDAGNAVKEKRANFNNLVGALKTSGDEIKNERYKLYLKQEERDQAVSAEKEKLAATRSRCAAEIVEERKKLAEIKKGREQVVAAEEQKLYAVRARVAAEIAEEQKKLDFVAKRHREAVSNNETLRLQNTLSKGMKVTKFEKSPEETRTEADLKAQEKIVRAKKAEMARIIKSTEAEGNARVKVYDREIAAQRRSTQDKLMASQKVVAAVEREGNARVNAINKEIVAQQALIASKINKRNDFAPKISGAKEDFVAAQNQYNVACEKYIDISKLATTAEGVLNKQKEFSIQKDMRRGKLIAMLQNKGNKTAQDQKRLSKLISGTSTASIRAGHAAVNMGKSMSRATAIGLKAWNGLKGFGSSLAGFFKANFAQIAASAAALAIQIVQGIQAANEASARRQMENVEQAQAAMEKKHLGNAKKREDAQTDFSRLQQLAEMSSQMRLTSEKIEEATNLINNLDPFGSSGWASIDKVTGKVNLARDAMDKFNKTLKENEIRDIKEEIRLARVAQETAITSGHKSTKTSRGRAEIKWMFEEGRKNKQLSLSRGVAQEYYEKYLRESEKIRKLQQKLDDLKNPPKFTREGAKKNIEAYAAQTKEEQDFLKNFFESHAGNSTELEKLNEEIKKYKKIYEKEEKRLMYQIGNARGEKRKKLEQDLINIQKKAVDAERNLVAQKAALEQTLKEQEDSIKNPWRKQEEAEKKEQAQEKLNEQYRKKMESGDFAGALKIWERAYKESQKSWEMALKQYNAKYAAFKGAATAGGTQITPEEKLLLQPLLEAANEARAKMKEQEKKLKDAQKEIKETSKKTDGKTTGAWSLRELLAQGVSSPAERTARGIETMVKKQKDIYADVHAIWGGTADLMKY